MCSLDIFLQTLGIGTQLHTVLNYWIVPWQTFGPDDLVLSQAILRTVWELAGAGGHSK